MGEIIFIHFCNYMDFCLICKNHCLKTRIIEARLPVGTINITEKILMWGNNKINNRFEICSR